MPFPKRLFPAVAYQTIQLVLYFFALPIVSIGNCICRVQKLDRKKVLFPSNLTLMAFDS